jgi:ribonucleoside-diphosphate reductase subunit M1
MAGNCAEIVEYSNAAEELIAVCNLASIPVNKYVQVETDSESQEKSCTFNHEGLGKAVEVLVENLNQIIDINYYPVEDCAKSNRRDRPIGIGIQGLADAFILMRYPFDSPEARTLNREIAETMYYHAVKASVRLAKETGETYSTFQGSPASKGIFHWEMWNDLRASRSPPLPPTPLTDRYDWVALREEMVTHGLKNSLLLAMMPTASTAQILGNNECIEPYTYNVYIRRVLSGEFKIVNPHLQRDLYERGLWTEEIRNDIIRDKGSIQRIEEIPEDLRALYKTSFEIKPSVIMNLAADRQAFVDQSQSMNLFISNPEDDLLITVYLYGWEQGLNTGLYYLRREAISSAQQFTVKPVKVSEASTTSKKKSPQRQEDETKPKPKVVEGDFCRKDDPDCLACQG